MTEKTLTAAELTEELRALADEHQASDWICDPIAIHLASLLSQVEFESYRIEVELHATLTREGRSPRARHLDALAWACQELESNYPASVDGARQIAAVSIVARRRRCNQVTRPATGHQPA
jgi:hypothetical protein